MANCKLAKNILKESACGYSLLKVVDIYLGNYSDVEANVEIADNEATITSGASTWFHIEPAKDSASFTDELQVTDGGAKYRTHTLNFSVDSGNYNAILRGDVDDIALGRYVAVARLANDKYILLGYPTPLEATSANVSGAASATDATAIQVVMVADTIETVAPLSAASVTALKASLPSA